MSGSLYILQHLSQVSLTLLLLACGVGVGFGLTTHSKDLHVSSYLDLQS